MKKNKSLFNKNNLLFISIILLISTFSCISYNYSISNRNVAYLYQAGKTSINPQFLIYHVSDTISSLFFKINEKELHFLEANENYKKRARIKIFYQIFSSLDSYDLIDSASSVIEIKKSNISEDFVSYIPLHIPDKSKFTIEIITSDLFNNNSQHSFLTIDKLNKYSGQNFLVKINNKVYFQNYLKKGDIFSLESARNKVEKYYISHFNKAFPNPYPPFSVINPKSVLFVADSIWTIRNDELVSIELKYSGMYHFRIDSTKKDGITLYNYGSYFPDYKVADKMLEPLVFLSSKKEMKQLKKFDDPKLALDSFWLNKSGNINRAKQLISVYYSRAKYSNIFFSSYQEGWKTDRGMIYIIYGEPKTIYKSDNNERWIYGNSTSDYSLDFTFNKQQNTFSENDFVLRRSDIYKNSWYKAIETWRDGRIYTIGK